MVRGGWGRLCEGVTRWDPCVGDERETCVPSEFSRLMSRSVCSHVQGMFNRTINMMEAGIKPVFVFDGKPPTMKGGEVHTISITSSTP